MPPREEWPIGRLEGAPSDDVGWHFGIPVGGSRNNVQCKFCGRVLRGGITRLKQHIAHLPGQVAGCPSVKSFVRENMMKLLKDTQNKKREEEEDIEDHIDEQIRLATQESIISQRQWEDRQRFRQQTGGYGNIHEQGGSSHASGSGAARVEDISFSLRSTDIDLARSQSMKQPKIKTGFMKTLRKKLGEAVSKFIIYDRLPMNLSNSPWLHNLIVAASELQAIVKQKQGLRNMFSSEEFRRSKFGRDKNGLAFEAREIVMGNDFWSKSNDILKVFEPIVKVLRLADGDEKPTMGFIYEAIDRAKQSIRQTSRYHSQYNEIIDKRWRFMHSDLHSAGYFLNPQFQYGVEHGQDVYKETFEGTNNVIMKLERNMDDQIKALNQLMLFKETSESFGTPQAQKAWSRMNPAEWWLVFDTCAPELQRLAIKILSQTTSTTNCERNWSTFSYIHTKTRNRLKYKKLQKLVFVHYNMKLKMRHEMRKSQEEIEASFNPINLDYIFQEDDPLSPWIEERENPLLDGEQNVEWLPRSDTDDEDVEAGDEDAHSNDNSGGLSTPSNNSGNGGDMVPSDSSFPSNRRGQSQSGRGKKKQNIPPEDSSSHIAQSFSDFSIDESSQSSQYYPHEYYQYPYFNAHNQSASDQTHPYHQLPMNYDDSYYPQQSGGFFNYVFGQGATQGDSQNESEGYDLPRHSTKYHDDYLDCFGDP
ncbi:Zinc finger, BED-type [Sesbania bispinosa]|nr:Zinc finger, BED-type [Sesbania bispinosa]